jgi:hypothetical protein
MLERDTDNSISLTAFKKLFIFKLLETLRYGNVTRGKSFDPKLFSSIFSQRSSADLALQESIKRSIQMKIEETTHIDPTKTSHFSEIMNYADAQQLISNLGFDLNLFCLQAQENDNKSYFESNLVEHTISCQETSTPRRGSFKQFEDFNGITIVPNDNPTPEQLALNDFLNEICLRMLDSCFHDACFVLVDLRDRTQVIDFQQIVNYQLSLDKHCSLQSLSVGLSTKNFLELLFEISSQEDVRVFLSSGCIEWRKLRAMFLKLTAVSGFQFDRILVCQDGLVSEAAGSNIKVYRLQDTARVELFPQGPLALQSYDSQTTLLISVQNGKMRRVMFGELVIDGIANTTNIDDDFVIH